MVVYAIEFEDMEDLKRGLQIAAHEFDVRNEDMLHCVLRERATELLACRELNVPYIAYEGRTSKVLDANVDIDNLPEGVRLFVRKSKSKRTDLLGLEQVCTEADDDTITYWPRHIQDPEQFLKRQVEVIPHGEFARRVKARELELPCFVKTMDKGISPTASLHHVIDEVTIELFNFVEEKSMVMDFHDNNSQISFLFKGQSYYNEVLGDMYRSHDMNHSLQGDFIVSDLMNIHNDGLGDKGTEEYRFFVVDDQPDSGSRYVDYDSMPVPLGAKIWAREFAARHKGTFGEAYVLDIAVTDQGFQLIELNGMTNAGRYLDNCPKELALAVRDRLGKGVQLPMKAPDVEIPDPMERPSVTLDLLFDDEDLGFGPGM